MKLSDIIVTEAIVPELASESRDEAIKELVGSLVAAGTVPQEIESAVVKAIVDREKEGSTGFGKGVAVPHVKMAQVPKMVGTVGCSSRGVNFSSLDGQPVYSIFLLLSPADQNQQHLQAMNLIFQNLQKDMFRKFLRQAQDRETVVELLREADAR